MQGEFFIIFTITIAVKQLQKVLLEPFQLTLEVRKTIQEAFEPILDRWKQLIQLDLKPIL